jgi:hypothetical protein
MATRIRIVAHVNGYRPAKIRIFVAAFGGSLDETFGTILHSGYTAYFSGSSYRSSPVKARILRERSATSADRQVRSSETREPSK